MMEHPISFPSITLMFRYGEPFAVSEEVLDPNFTLPIGKAKVRPTAAGQGRVGQGRAGQGRAGQGRAGQDEGI